VRLRPMRGLESLRLLSTSAGPVEAQIKQVGDKIREMKANKVDKAEIKDVVGKLLALKAEYEKITGMPFDPPKEKETKKAKQPEAKVTKAAKAESVVEPSIEIVSKNYFEVDETDGEIEFGDYVTMQSDARIGRTFVEASTLGKPDGPKEGETVWLRGRVSSVRAKGNACFIVVRCGSFYTVQAVHFKNSDTADVSKGLIKYAGALALESIVDIQGVVVGADVKSCSQSNVELQIKKLMVVSRAPTVLPFLLEDAARSDAVIEASQNTERPFAKVAQDMRLNNRWLDLRVPSNNAIMRIRSGVSTLFRLALLDEGFTEIQTPKLIAGESEGGSEVFRTDYFGTPACLAQSPQLYKQMAISSDLDRVFEVGPVFRAENSNTRRHLCEFTGLDMEMAIGEHYDECLGVIHRMFRTIFNGLEERFPTELAAIREQYPSEPVVFTDEPLILHWPEAMKMLVADGVVVDPMGDLNTATEVRLGELVKAKYKTDFFILDRYPSGIRPFYTMPCADDPRYSNSYDIFIRGQEICSGAQRCHDVPLLTQRILDKGMSPDTLHFYLDAFRHGVKPHAGAGIGLDRVVFLYLGLDNVRKASMFPRDPNRVSP